MSMYILKSIMSLTAWSWKSMKPSTSTTSVGYAVLVPVALDATLSYTGIAAVSFRFKACSASKRSPGFVDSGESILMKPLYTGYDSLSTKKLSCEMHSYPLSLAIADHMDVLPEQVGPARP